MQVPSLQITFFLYLLAHLSSSLIFFYGIFLYGCRLERRFKSLNCPQFPFSSPQRIRAASASVQLSLPRKSRVEVLASRHFRASHMGFGEAAGMRYFGKVYINICNFLNVALYSKIVCVLHRCLPGERRTQQSNQDGELPILQLKSRGKSEDVQEAPIPSKSDWTVALLQTQARSAEFQESRQHFLPSLVGNAKAAEAADQMQQRRGNRISVRVCTADQMVNILTTLTLTLNTVSQAGFYMLSLELIQFYNHV